MFSKSLLKAARTSWKLLKTSSSFVPSRRKGSEALIRDMHASTSLFE